MVYVYAIKSINKKYRYIGITNDLERRLNQHNKGHNKSTASYTPYNLILKEARHNYQEARKREIFLKSGAGRKYLDSLES